MDFLGISFDGFQSDSIENLGRSKLFDLIGAPVLSSGLPFMVQPSVPTLPCVGLYSTDASQPQRLFADLSAKVGFSWTIYGPFHGFCAGIWGLKVLDIALTAFTIDPKLHQLFVALPWYPCGLFTRLSG